MSEVGEQVERWLIDLAKRDKLSQGYLFVGPRGVGKFEAGVVIAQTIFCLSEDKPCGTCVGCKQVLSGVHPDLRVVADDGSRFTIEQVREVRSWLGESSFSGKGKLLLVEEIGRAGVAAQNALLKSIEEPSPRTRIIVTDSNDSALPTIRSRMQRVHFGLVNTETAELSGDLAGVVRGRPKAAERYIKEGELAREDEALIADFAGVGEAAIAELSLLVDRLIERDDLPRVVELWILATSSRFYDNEADSRKARIAAELFNLRQQLLANVNPRLALWASLLKIRLLYVDEA